MVAIEQQIDASCCFHFLIAESPFYCSLPLLVGSSEKKIASPTAVALEVKMEAVSLSSPLLPIALWQSVCKQRAICNDGIFCSERKWKLFLQLLNCSVTNSLQTICLLHNLHIHKDFSLKLGIFTSASARLTFSVL